MADTRKAIAEEELDQVVGGYMNFNYHKQILTYTHEETKQVTRYKILDFEHAWKRSNELHSTNIHEDDIIADLKLRGFIA